MTKFGIDSSLVFGSDGKSVRSILDELLKTAEDIQLTMTKNIQKIGISALDARFGVKGDGVTDDTNALSAVHTYANDNNLPVWYPPVTFALTKPTKNIFIRTNVDFGKAKFIIDEQYNTTNPRFQVNSYSTRIALSDELNKLGGGVVTMDTTKKAAILTKLKKKEYVIPELAQYKGNYMIVKDDNDKIGKRQGSNANEGFERTDMFIIEEGGRIIGDISQDFSNFTLMTIQPVEEDWLTITGGSFYLKSGTNLALLDSYVYPGFLVRRCKTRFEGLYVRFHENSPDVSLNESNGFINASGVCDWIVDNCHIVPRIYETENGTPQGTYGLGGKTCMNVIFRNIRGEGDETSWGLFAPNIFKNFKLENCEVNRIDTHFWLWNLDIENCVVGNRGISISGGGRLSIVDTVVHGDQYVNFRKDYGARWDGDIRIYNSTLYPYDDTRDIHFMEYEQANYDHQYTTPLARSIVVRDLMVDFRYMKVPFEHVEVIDGKNVTVKGKNILMNLPTFGQRTSGYRVEFPKNVIFENCRVAGANATGFIYMHIPEPHKMKVYGGSAGSYNATDGTVKTNSTMVFRNMDTYDFGAVNPQETTKDGTTFYLWGYNTTGYSSDGVMPDVLFENCGKIFISLKSSIANVIIRNCIVNALDHLEGGDGRSVVTMENCILAPDLVTGQSRAYYVTARLVNLINCQFELAKQNGTPSYYARNDDGSIAKDGSNNSIKLDHGIIYPNSSIRANTVNCRMLESYITAWEAGAATTIASAYLDKVANGCLRRASDGINRIYP